MTVAPHRHDAVQRAALNGAALSLSCSRIIADDDLDRRVARCAVSLLLWVRR